MRSTIRVISAILLAMVQLAVTAPLKIPLKSRSMSDHARLPRHVVRSNAPMSPISLTDWFNRTDNQRYSYWKPAPDTPVAKYCVRQPRLTESRSVLWDTGSPFLLLPNNSCTNCGDHRLFDPGNSSTFQALQPQTIDNISFVTGADATPLSEAQSASCIEDADTVSIGSFAVVHQSFMLCDSYGPFMSQPPMDGIMGMALPGRTSVKSFFWSLWDGGILPSPVFSFYMPAGNITGGELILGDIDDSKYTGKLSYTNLSPRPSALDLGWVVDQQALYSGDPSKGPSHMRRLLDSGSGQENTPVNGSGWAILDTGTAFIQTPDNATAAAIYADISPWIQPIGSLGAWGADCDLIDNFAPNITLTLGTGAQATNLTLPSSSFNLGSTPACRICARPPSVPSFGDSDEPIWIIGSPLIKAYYTVWDGVNQTVGWGELVH
ncbi:hypothetical protein PG990_013621 [Apiospora arundinis]